MNVGIDGKVIVDEASLIIDGIPIGPTPPQPEPPLPYDAEVEYLESTGTQYIDTGVAYDHTCVVSLDFSPAAISNAYLFGILWAPAAASTIRRWAVTSERTPALQSYTTINIASSVAISVGGRYSLAATFGAITINGTTTSVTSSTFDPTDPVNIYLFARHTYAPLLDPNPVTAPSKVVLYASQIQKGGVLVRDLTPVRVGSGSSAVGYLYDRISGELFGNAADGQGGKTGFPANCVGPDKNQT